MPAQTRALDTITVSAAALAANDSLIFLQASSNAARLRAYSDVLADLNADVNLNWQGAWATSTAYAKADEVSNDPGGGTASYICIVAHTSSASTEPGVGADWATYWDLRTSPGTGDVTGAASSTDNAVVRFDGTTGKIIQNSSVTIDDLNNVVVPAAAVTLDGGMNDSPTFTLRATYDSNTTTSITSSNYDATFVHNITAGGASPASQVDLSIGGTARHKFFSDGRLETGAATFTSAAITTGNLVFNNARLIRWKSSGGTEQDVLGVNASDILTIGGGGNLTATRIFGGASEALRINSSLNIGIGTTDIEATAADRKSLQLGATAIVTYGSGFAEYGNNWYYDGSYKYRTTATAAMYQIIGGEHIFRVAPSGTIDTGVSFTKALTIKNDGLLETGKGLHVTGNNTISSGAGVQIRYDGTNGILSTYDNGAAAYKNMQYNSLSHTFEVGGAAALTIANDAKPTRLTTFALIMNNFDNGTGVGREVRILRNDNTTTPAAGHLFLQDLGATAYYVWPDDTGVLRIGTLAPDNANDTSGTVVGAQTSDIRLKTDVTPFLTPDFMRDRLMGLNLYRYRFKDDSQRQDKEMYGLVVREEDRGSWWTMNDHRNDTYAALDEANLFGHIIGGFQDHEARIAELEAHLATLKGEA